MLNVWCCLLGACFKSNSVQLVVRGAMCDERFEVGYIHINRTFFYVFPAKKLAAELPSLVDPMNYKLSGGHTRVPPDNGTQSLVAFTQWHSDVSRLR